MLCDVPVGSDLPAAVRIEVMNATGNAKSSLDRRNAIRKESRPSRFIARDLFGIDQFGMLSHAGFGHLKRLDLRRILTSRVPSLPLLRPFSGCHYPTKHVGSGRQIVGVEGGTLSA